MQTATHPVQVQRSYGDRPRRRISTIVTARAYEVYVALYGEQKSLVEGECRGGFSAAELIAFLYAYPFQRDQRRNRVDEALNGMEGL